MTEQLQWLIESLRGELYQCGEVLALFDQFEKLALPTGSDRWEAMTAQIDAQGELILTMCQYREVFQQDLARSLGLPADAWLTVLIQSLSNEYQPLLQALAEENHRSFQRIRAHAAENPFVLGGWLRLIPSWMDQSPSSPPARCGVRKEKNDKGDPEHVISHR